MKNMILQTEKNPDRKIDERAESIIGKTGIAITDFMPSGKADINGTIVEAISIMGHIHANDKVEIVEKKDFNFTVKRVD